MDKYVQHISGQGEKFKLREETQYGYTLEESHGWYVVPKSEYRLVEPPEQWVDVTAGCRPENLLLAYDLCWNHRIRKVQLTEDSRDGRYRTYYPASGWALIVEKKQ